MMTLFVISTFLYFLGMIKYLLYLALRNRTLFVLATVMIALGFAVETAALVLRSAATGHGPYMNIFEYLVFLAWVVFAVFLVAEGYFRIKPLGAFMVPIGFLIMLLALLMSPETEPSLPVKAYWLTLHRTLSFLAFGAFSLVFAAGLMYLIQERQLKTKHFGGWYKRLPSLSILDEANRMGLIFGFPIITVGAGAAIVWSTQKYGAIMKLNTSTASLLIAWGVYATLGLGRLAFGWRGRKAAALGVAGYVIVIASLLLHLGR
ncbi:MAG: cytochrome C assembly family protein [Candidatus Nitrospinota bacterium M3_3B_026]